MATSPLCSNEGSSSEMSFATIRVTISPSPRAVAKVLDELGESYADWTPAFRRMVPLFAKEAPKGILTQGRALEDPAKWAPLARSTILRKGEGKPPLVDTGELLRSLANATLSKVSITPRRVRYSPGDHVQYAYPLHFGEDEISTTSRSVRMSHRETKRGKTKTLHGAKAARSFRKEVRKNIRKFERSQGSGYKLSKEGKASFLDAADKKLNAGAEVAGDGRLPARRLLGPTKGLDAKVERIMEEHSQRLIEQAIQRLNSGPGEVAQ